MLDIGYDFIIAKDEIELRKKLVALQMKTGYTYQIINIYPRGKKVVAWYYSKGTRK